jgi:HD-GYP domain-containing protein (c-di-GMP phosphodiesterase class II)
VRGRHVVRCTLGTLAIVVALWIVRPGALAHLDARAYDELLRRTPAPRATGRVSIVAIDERSIAEIGQWPWRRDVIARLVERLRHLGARVVAFDIILSEPDRLGTPVTTRDGGDAGTTTTDAALAATLEQHRVVTSYAFTFDAAAGTSSSCVLHPLRAVQIAAPGHPSPSLRLFRPSGVVCSLAIFNQASGASGFLNVSRDPDGVVRRVPLVLEYRDEIYPSLALAAVQHMNGSGGVTISTTSGQRLTLDLAGQMIPLDAYGRLLPRFRSGRAFRFVGASDVLEGRVAAGAFTDHVVFVGGTALGVTDTVATPLDTAFPGVEVHATVADSLLGRRFISVPAYAGAYDLGSAVAAVLAVAALTTAGGLLWGGLWTAIGCVCLWMLAAWLLDTRHTFFSPVLATLSATMSLAVVTVAKVVDERRRAETEQRRRQRAHRFIVESLTSLTETRDVDTGRHVRRTQGYTRVVANELAKVPRFRRALTPETIELMAILAPLHDIGKVGIPDAVLNKPGPLTSDEYSRMRTHPHLGYNAIVNAEAASLIEDEEVMSLAKEMVLTHHEWWDGHGYPQGLAGEQIPVGGRVLAIVDVYDALVGSRPYRAAMPHDQAVAAIRAQRGTHFDPDVVDAFVAVERDIKDLSQRLNPAA